ncbi:hypothetical protein AB1N83_011473, partial [Pleurotus pulmonarius]
KCQSYSKTKQSAKSLL